MHPVASSLLPLPFLISLQSSSCSLSTIPLITLSIHSTAFTHFCYFTAMMSKSSHCLSVCLYARMRQHGTALRVFHSTSESRLCHHPVPLLVLFLFLFQLMSPRPLRCSPSTLLLVCCSTRPCQRPCPWCDTRACAHDGRYARCMSRTSKKKGNAMDIGK